LDDERVQVAADIECVGDRYAPVAFVGPAVAGTARNAEQRGLRELAALFSSTGFYSC